MKIDNLSVTRRKCEFLEPAHRSFCYRFGFVAKDVVDLLWPPSADDHPADFGNDFRPKVVPGRDNDRDVLGYEPDSGDHLLDNGRRS